MTSYVFSVVTTFQIWACHVTCVYKLSKIFISSDMSLIPALVLELKCFFGGLNPPPPGGIGLIINLMYNVSIHSKPDHSPPGDPSDRVFSLPGRRVFAKLSLPGGRGFE